MMKKLIPFFCCLIVNSISAQIDTVQVRTYGGQYNDYGSEIVETSDGGYAIIGTTGSYGQGQSNVYLLKINEELEKEWSHVYGGDNIEWGQSLVEVNDGFLLLGYTNSFGAGGYDIYLVKTDLNGNLQWQKTFGGSDWDFGYKILEYNNSFYIAGETWSSTNGGSDGYLIQINDTGDELWSEHFGGNFDDAFYDLFVGNNGVVAVGTLRPEIEEPKAFLVEIMSDNTTSEHLFGEADEMLIARAGIIHSNGDYYLSGQRYLIENWDYLFLRLDSDFNEIPVSTNTYGGTGKDIAFSMTEVSSGNVTMVGESDSFTGSVGIMVLRVTEFGNYQAAPTHGTQNVDIGKSVIVNSNEELVILGETNSYGEGNYDVYLLEFSDDTVNTEYFVQVVNYLDSLLTFVPEIHLKNFDNILFPNPATDELYISSSHWNNISFFNLSGQLVDRQGLVPGQSSVSVADLAPGLYVVRLSDGEVTHQQKIMIE